MRLCRCDEIWGRWQEHFALRVLKRRNEMFHERPGVCLSSVLQAIILMKHLQRVRDQARLSRQREPLRTTAQMSRVQTARRGAVCGSRNGGAWWKTPALRPLPPHLLPQDSPADLGQGVSSYTGQGPSPPSDSNCALGSSLTPGRMRRASNSESLGPRPGFWKAASEG